MDFHSVIDFWFDEIDPRQWWNRDDEFDRRIHERFGAAHAQASRCELYHWRATPLGRLAEIVVLDQFSRNMYRNSAQAFACDPLALALAQEAIATHADKALEPARRAFLVMPFMHSESLVIHEIAVKLFGEPGLQSNLDFELRHKAIIERFGRFPHRNASLGRTSSAEEVEFLKTPGSSF